MVSDQQTRRFFENQDEPQIHGHLQGRGLLFDIGTKKRYIISYYIYKFQEITVK